MSTTEMDLLGLLIFVKVGILTGSTNWVKTSKNIWGVIQALKIQDSRKNQNVKFRKVEQRETAPIQRRKFR